MATYQGKSVKLNSPSSIGKGEPGFGRKKSFRARHKCDTATDKTTPRYWSCKAW